MGYKNPQRIIDKSFDAFTNASKRWVGQIATSTAQIQERNRLEKEQQQLEWEKQNEAQQLMYSKVNELGSTGNSPLDENIRGFWDNRVDQYFEIKNMMSRGDMEQKEGNRLLSQITGEVDKFQKVVPYLASQTALQREAGKLEPGTAGAISSVTPGESQGIFNSILEGGNTAIVSKGGSMYLYNPPMPGQQDGGMVNLDEMLAKQAVGENIVKTVPDISKDLAGAFNNIFKPDDVDSEFVDFKTVNKGDGYKYTYKTISEEKKLEGIQSMKDNGQFDPVLNNKDMMTSVWQDMIPDDYLKENGVDPNSSWEMMDPALNSQPEKQKEYLALQRDIAMNWLADQAYDNNSEMDQGALKFVNKQKIPKPSKSSTSTSSGGGDPLKGYTPTVRTEIKHGKEKFNNAMVTIDEIYTNSETPIAEDIITQLNDAPYDLSGGEEWWIGDSDTEGEVDGLIYSTGRKRGYPPEFFHGEQGRANFENAYLDQLFKSGEAIDYLRNNQTQSNKAPKPWPDQATFDANWASATSGQTVVGVDGNYYKKP